MAICFKSDYLKNNLNWLKTDFQPIAIDELYATQWHIVNSWC